MNKILITGISGFIGSHIAELLIKNNFLVIGLKRKNSNLWRCQEFKDNITWVEIDDEQHYKDTLTSHGFDVLIHCAWMGVEANDRYLWELQARNFNFLSELLEISKKASVKKVIILGSQSEYGKFEGNISESHVPNPIHAYGAVKLSCLELTKYFSNINNINWVWLRIFSLFGEKEGNTWLIPNTINAIKNNSKLELTLGEQKYAYLYIKDFAEIILRIVEKNINSGIYNVSSNKTTSIKSIINKIKDNVNPLFELKFGTIDYRQNQSMHIEGNIQKLENQIGNIHFTDFEFALNNTINFYKK
jgi:nucleoside-diphosphate-sugar epimerase